MDERLRPTDKLKTSAQFDAVFRRGKCYRSEALRIHFLENRGPSSRLGLVVTRRSGNAVARARIRRLLREVFRRNRRILQVPLDLVLVAQGPPRPHAAYLTAFRTFGEWLTRPRKERARR